MLSTNTVLYAHFVASSSSAIDMLITGGHGLVSGGVSTRRALRAGGQDQHDLAGHCAADPVALPRHK